MPVYFTKENRQREAEIDAALEKRWGVKVVRFGALDAIDTRIEKNGATVGVLEMKDRNIATTTYATVYLSFRKWFALMFCAICTGFAPIFVVRFTDGTRWINVWKVDARRMTMCVRRDMRSKNDREPCIEVPVADMRPL